MGTRLYSVAVAGDISVIPLANAHYHAIIHKTTRGHPDPNVDSDPDAKGTVLTCSVLKLVNRSAHAPCTGQAFQDLTVLGPSFESSINVND